MCKFLDKIGGFVDSWIRDLGVRDFIYLTAASPPGINNATPHVRIVALIGFQPGIYYS